MILYAVNAALQLRAMIYMDVTGKIRISLFINLDYLIKQFFDTVAGTAYRWHHRHSQKPSELADIQSVSFCLKFIKHIQGHYYPEVHIYQLGGQVEVTLEVGRIHDIDDHIGNIIDQTLTYIKFFRAVR